MAVHVIRRIERAGILDASKDNGDLVGVKITPNSQRRQIRRKLEIVLDTAVALTALVNDVSGLQQ
jgi:hypothetical protein